MKRLLPALRATALASLFSILLTPALALRGDANEDGSVTTADVSVLQDAIVGRVSLNQTAQQNADVNGNAATDVGDLVLLMRMIDGVSVPVPSVLWEGQHRARVLIEDAGLAVGEIRPVESSAFPGSVVGQKPVAGTGVTPGSAVDLFVADAAGPSIEISPTEVDLGTSGTTAVFQINCVGDESLPWYSGMWADHTATPWRGTGDATITLTLDRTHLPKGDVNLTFGVVPDTGTSADGAYATVRMTQQNQPPPRLSYIAAHMPCSPGDTIKIEGSLFATNAEDNEIRIGSDIVQATSVYPSRVTFRIPETVSPGAVSFQVRRAQDANLGSSTWSKPLTARLVAPTQFDLRPGRDGLHLWNEPPWHILLKTIDAAEIRDRSVGPSDWILSATNLEWLDGAYVNSLGAIMGTSEPNMVLEVILEGQTFTMPVRRLNATEVAAMPSRMDEEDLEQFRPLLTPGAVLSARLWGSEKETFYARSSDWRQLAVSANPPLIGSVFQMSPINLVVPQISIWEWTPEIRIQAATGSTLLLEGWSYSATDNVLTAPGLWEGELIFANSPYSPDPGLLKYAVPLNKPGSYAISNLSNGAVRHLDVLADGAPNRSVQYEETDVPLPSAINNVILPPDKDTSLFANGAELHVPAGALETEEGMMNLVSFGYSEVWHESAVDLDDPEMEDGRERIEFSFARGSDTGAEPPVDWEPDRLLKAITLKARFREEQMVNGPPSIAALDEASGIYWELPCTADAAGRGTTLRFPASVYGAGTTKDGKAAAPTGFPPVRIHTITRSMGIPWVRSSRAIITDADNRFAVDYITDPSSSSYASDVYATGILETMLDAYEFLEGESWRTPDDTTFIYLRKNLIFSGYGSTTKAVFGRPTVTINIAECPILSPAYYTTAAHEVAHVFQREYTTNIIAKWFDEASAEWVALSTVGDSNFLKDTVNDAMPFTSPLPGGFTFGYSTEQGYAASPWTTWLEKNYSGTVREVYEALDSDPLVWENHHGAVASATGKSIGTLYRDFAKDYWLQNFAPIEGADFNSLAGAALGHSAVQTMTNGGDVTFADTRAALSSVRFSIQQDDACLARYAGRPMVLRIKPEGESALGRVSIYGEQWPATSPPNEPMELGELSGSDSEAIVLDDGTANRTLRLVVANGSSINPFLVTIRAVYPRLDSMAPTSGRYQGGYTVSLQGNGFGETQGTIRISGDDVEIVSWTDTRVQFRMPNVGEYTSSASINVRTAEDVATTSLEFTFTN